MGNFTFEEMNLMCIYNTGSRTGLMEALTEMRGELSPEETELRELTDSALTKLCAMTDEKFAELELYFETTLIDRRIRIITSSFEAWYQKQTHYVKISERSNENGIYREA